MPSFFPWQGGKSKQAARLCQLLAEHTCYVEVFAGAANLLFAKPKSRTEVINDVNSDLVTLFRVVRYHRREFFRHLSFVTHSRAEFTDFMSQPGLTDIQRAARSFFIMKTAFGGRAGCRGTAFGYRTTGGACFNRRSLSSVTRCSKRLSGVFIEHLDFADLISRYDRKHTLFYCDPPYLDTAGYKAGFTFDDHVRLAKLLSSIKGRFLLSINDHPKIRKLYKGFPKLKVGVKYTVARDKTAAAKTRPELVIANYPLPRKW